MSSSNRNLPCPCGSGKRYKHCCGALAARPGPGIATLHELMYSALGLQQSGALNEAEHLYHRALEIEPGNADALHMLGTICYLTGRLWEAFDLICRGLELTDWQFPTMRYNLGLVVASLMQNRSTPLDGNHPTDEPHLSALNAAADKLAALAFKIQQHELAGAQEPLIVPRASVPDVSIVIPTYGQHVYTRSCVLSIVRHTDLQRCEIVVVDDASPEPASVALADAQGLRVVRNESNLGFIGSCNRGAECALGELLVFLNNDTLVTAGWLTGLLDALGEPGVGLVGAKLIFPDGRLQEAGGIIWRNGSASNFGRDDDPGKPEYNYLRDADYCSGACLAVRRGDFFDLRGFDPLFAPAYYEDTDLAMRMRAAGKRVVYQPAATIVHFEGATSGRDLAAGVKRHQLVNQTRFLARWREALAHHRVTGDRPDLAKDRNRSLRVLVVDAYLPVPDKDSGSVRIAAIMRLLVSAGCKVTFVAQSLEFVEGYAQKLQQAGVEVLHHPYVWSMQQILAHRGAELDLIVACRYPVAESLVESARRYAPDALFALDTVDLHFLREAREAALTGDAVAVQHAELTRQRELAVMRRVDAVLVVSEYERKLLAEVGIDAPVLVLSNVHDVEGRMANFETRSDIFFLGGFNHPPNVDAVEWYVTQVWPLVRTRLPQARTYLIGSNMPAGVRALSGNGIEAVGHVPDLAPYLDGCRLSVAPLRYGAGVKGKISTAQARGVPVVATSLAVEGMFLTHGLDTLVADTAVAFADAVVQIYSDAALWMSVSDAGLRNVEHHFSPEAAARSLQQLLALATSGRLRQEGKPPNFETADASPVDP